MPTLLLKFPRFHFLIINHFFFFIIFHLVFSADSHRKHQTTCSSTKLLSTSGLETPSSHFETACLLIPHLLCNTLPERGPPSSEASEFSLIIPYLYYPAFLILSAYMLAEIQRFFQQPDTEHCQPAVAVCCFAGFPSLSLRFCTIIKPFCQIHNKISFLVLLFKNRIFHHSISFLIVLKSCYPENDKSIDRR